MKQCHIIGMTVTGATLRANLLGEVLDRVSRSMMPWQRKRFLAGWVGLNLELNVVCSSGLSVALMEPRNRKSYKSLP